MTNNTYTSDKRSNSKIYYPYRWYLVAIILISLIDFILLIKYKWQISAKGIIPGVFFIAIIAAPLLLKRYNQNPKIKNALACCTLLIIFSLCTLVFDYFVISTNAPNIDSWLSTVDRFFGFDWPNVILWAQRKPIFSLILIFAYSSFMPQASVVIIHLSFTGRLRQLTEFNTIFIITNLITIIFSGFFPAAGPGKYYQGLVHVDLSGISQLEPLRDGTLRTIDLAHLQGLVSIPSFHTIMAILLTYSMRHTKMRWIFLILNITMLVSIPICGEHYLTDMIGGVITVALVIAGWNFVAYMRDRASPGTLNAFTLDSGETS